MSTFTEQESSGTGGMMARRRPHAAHPEALPPLQAPRLMDQLRERIQYLHYSRRTEQAYVHWCRAFIRFHGLRHPAEMGAAEVQAFLQWLAADREVAASTHNQALSAILFLYTRMLELHLPWLTDIGRPAVHRRLPVVLTPTQVAAVLSGLHGEHGLLARLLYGTGLRLQEALQLRVKDVDFAHQALIVRAGNGDIGHALPTLIQRGLTAQLGTQSLLTGQLYIDLDIRTKPQGVLHAGYDGDAVQIPTSPTAFQALKSQLESVDLKKILDDLSQIANAARSLLTAPGLKQGLQDFAATAGHARQLAARLEQRAAPLTRGADNARLLLDPNGPVARDLQRALDELARASGSLRQAADGEGPLLQQTERAMRDLSQTARALRRLANTLDAQPEALLRGRRPDVNPPAPASEPAR